MKRWLKRVPVILIALAVLAVVAWSFVPQPVDVDTGEVVVGPMQVTVNDDGQTRVRERYVVSAPLAGMLRRIELDPGDEVIAGETVVAVIEPSPASLLDERSRAEAEARVRAAEAAVRQTQAAIEQSRARLGQAEIDRDRYLEMASRNAASKDEVDRAVLEVQVQQAAVDAALAAEQRAQFELEQARAALLAVTSAASSTGSVEPFEVHSPVGGHVLRVIQESQATVAPGEPLLEVADVSDLEVVVDVLSRDAVAIRPGAAVLLEQWGGDQPLAGVVRYVEPSGFTKVSALGVEEQRVNVIIDLSPSATALPAELNVGDNYRVDARIVTWSSENVLKIPAGALFRDGQAWATFVLSGDRAELREIEIGHLNNEVAEVISGLTAGEQVILHPSDKISDGTAVRPRQAAQ